MVDPCHAQLYVINIYIVANMFVKISNIFSDPNNSNLLIIIQTCMVHGKEGTLAIGQCKVAELEKINCL